MIIQQLKVLNELGIHARVASRLVRCASSFESSINGKKENKFYNLKNVLGVMTLNSKCNEVVTIEIDGPDEVEAAQAIKQLFEIKFGEK
jgi:phosphocarrier protein HPr